MIREFIEKIEAKRDLTQAEASALMLELLGGRIEEAEIVSLLSALRDKGATVEELIGFASVMRSKARETLEEGGV
ncbi:MAG: anthranilate phosphoribosyltransferase, partial [Acidobacteria bacterium]|nr:anthranilate phosphoribosyltransferase [Acidobacteriota bacterium]